MNPELKHKWTAGLRSGDYPQTVGELKNDEGYCCLGVLCDVIDKTEWEQRPEGNYYDNLSSCLSYDMRKLAGISVETEGQLIELNDVSGRSFKEIADWIDEAL